MIKNKKKIYEFIQLFWHKMKATVGKKQSAVQIKKKSKKIIVSGHFQEKEKNEKTKDERSGIGIADSAKKRHVIETREFYFEFVKMIIKIFSDNSAN